jgi:AcrR family transcriptional regulator
VDDKRQRILAAARKRFRYYGVRKTTMHEIARDAGVAVGTL